MAVFPLEGLKQIGTCSNTDTRIGSQAAFPLAGLKLEEVSVDADVRDWGSQAAFPLERVGSNPEVEFDRKSNELVK